MRQAAFALLALFPLIHAVDESLIRARGGSQSVAVSSSGEAVTAVRAHDREPDHSDLCASLGGTMKKSSSTICCHSSCGSYCEAWTCRSGGDDNCCAYKINTAGKYCGTVESGGSAPCKICTEDANC